jgi:hypothetical protein
MKNIWRLELFSNNFKFVWKYIKHIIKQTFLKVVGVVPIIQFALIVGKLIYLTNIHLNIKYVTIVNIYYMSAPCQTHIEIMKHIFKYDLQGMWEHGILYREGNMNVTSGYIHAN